MSDALMNGKRIRTVNVLDDYNRAALGIKTSVSLPSKSVTEFLDRIANHRGYPIQLHLHLHLHLDNVQKIFLAEMTSWAKKHGYHIHYIQPGKSTQNAYYAFI